jgi:hypothetical protein
MAISIWEHRLDQRDASLNRRHRAARVLNAQGPQMIGFLKPGRGQQRINLIYFTSQSDNQDCAKIWM